MMGKDRGKENRSAAPGQGPRKQVRPPSAGQRRAAPTSSSAPAPAREAPTLSNTPDIPQVEGMISQVKPADRTRVDAEPGTPRVRPAAPIRPAVPIRSAAPPPVARPSIGPVAQPPGPQQFEEEFVDDDLAIAPAPDASAFFPKQAPARSVAFARARSLGYKRTLIPLLLVNSIALPALARLWYLTDIDAPIRVTGDWLPKALLGTGAAAFILAIWHMISVRRLTARDAGR